MSPLEARNALQAALAQHQAGRLAEAEALYRRILAGYPRHPDALHFLGLLAHQRGQHADAVALMDQALHEAPGHAACHSNRGNALLALGRPDEAVASFHQALALDRNFAEAHLNLGNALQQQGLPDEAIASYRRALRLKPQSAETHYNLGRVYEAQGKTADASRSYRRAVTLRPDYAEAHFNLGNVLQAAGQPQEAVASYQRAVTLKPDHAEAHNNLGAQLEITGRLDEAAASYRRALALRPDFPEAHNNLGNVLLAAGRPDEAIASYQAAIARRPDYAEAHNNLGNALQAAGRLDEAVRSHDRALGLRPDFPDARWNKSFALLLQGDFAAGWPLFEARWELLGNHPDVPVFDRPLWLGDAPLAGRTLLVHHEQGLGDTLQMLRYVPLLAARGARVVLQVPAALAALAATVPGVDAVVAPGTPLPPHDLHCPCMSLPLACGTTLSTIPAEVPYLSVPEVVRAAWQARLGDRSGQPRIGLAWSGSTAHRNDRQRSVALRDLLPLLATPAEFHSLQKEYRPDDQEQFAADGRLRDWSAALDDFADTAGLIGRLDLVIAVDTAVAHLAGALGKPVWLLLPAAPDYRWLLGRTDSPWYPTMRLFRQPAPGNPGDAWQPVLHELSAALATFLHH
ncbi:MAG: tetratricopeptide repeat protein [Chromatiales bacterium]|nr:tetratricopeptide repeat protein [Chromatiales bacterium]